MANFGVISILLFFLVIKKMLYHNINFAVRIFFPLLFALIDLYTLSIESEEAK